MEIENFSRSICFFEGREPTQLEIIQEVIGLNAETVEILYEVINGGLNISRNVKTKFKQNN